MNDKLQITTFEYLHLIPDDFTGWCFVLNNSTRYYYKNKKFSIDPANPDEPSLSKTGSSSWWIENAGKHRIGGPARIWKKHNIFEFWIENKKYSEKQYWSHPLIVDYTIKKILEYSVD